MSSGTLYSSEKICSTRADDRAAKYSDPAQNFSASAAGRTFTSCKMQDKHCGARCGSIITEMP